MHEASDKLPCRRHSLFITITFLKSSFFFYNLLLYKFIINESWLCDYAESSQPFDEIKHRHILKEVGDVAEGVYDR